MFKIASQIWLNKCLFPKQGINFFLCCSASIIFTNIRFSEFCTPFAEWTVSSKRAVEYQPEMKAKVTVCHCDRNTHTIIHGAAVKQHFKSWSEGTWRGNNLWSLIYGSIAPFDGVSEWSSRERDLEIFCCCFSFTVDIPGVWGFRLMTPLTGFPWWD